MRWVNDMEEQIQALREIDTKIKSLLNINDFDVKEVTQLVDIREQLLQELLNQVSQNPALGQSQLWQDTVQDTQQLVELMQAKTTMIGQDLQKFRHGNKSVQQYKKFL